MWWNRVNDFLLIILKQLSEHISFNFHPKSNKELTKIIGLDASKYLGNNYWQKSSMPLSRLLHDNILSSTIKTAQLVPKDNFAKTLKRFIPFISDSKQVKRCIFLLTIIFKEPVRECNHYHKKVFKEDHCWQLKIFFISIIFGNANLLSFTEVLDYKRIISFFIIGVLEILGNLLFSHKYV